MIGSPARCQRCFFTARAARGKRTWQTLEQRSADARATDGDCRAARGKRTWQTLEQRSADARATDGDCRAARGKRMANARATVG